ncbi:MAG: hypothetical protein JWO58_2976, partial [Chitinophagaceae bacterium]|nr:hypothetical protein [Chitinophagaceae bacterium]
TAPFSGLNDIDIYTLVPKLQLAVGNTPVANYSFDFGNLIVGNQLDSQLAVSNEGDYELLFTPDADKINVTGDTGDFTIDLSSLQATDTLDPAQILRLPIHFHPTSAGGKSITLQVLSNDPAAPTYSFTLQGNGTIANATENSLASSQTVSIYPVPCSAMLQIKINTSFQQASLQLSDLNGKLIHESYDLTSFTQLSTVTIPNGIYLLNVQTDDNRFQSKVVVTH